MLPRSQVGPPEHCQGHIGDTVSSNLIPRPKPLPHVSMLTASKCCDKGEISRGAWRGVGEGGSGKGEGPGVHASTECEGGGGTKGEGGGGVCACVCVAVCVRVCWVCVYVCGPSHLHVNELLGAVPAGSVLPLLQPPTMAVHPGALQIVALVKYVCCSAQPPGQHIANEGGGPRALRCPRGGACTCVCVGGGGGRPGQVLHRLGVEGQGVEVG